MYPQRLVSLEGTVPYKEFVSEEPEEVEEESDEVEEESDSIEESSEVEEG